VQVFAEVLLCQGHGVDEEGAVLVLGHVHRLVGEVGGFPVDVVREDRGYFSYSGIGGNSQTGSSSFVS
jgi:hypothetical protein